MHACFHRAHVRAGVTRTAWVECGHAEAAQTQNSSSPWVVRFGPGSSAPEELRPYLELMVRADAAERRGDALGALEALDQRPLGPDGKLFWRRERLTRLTQLALLGPVLPPWVRARWILAQALQQWGGATNQRMTRALEVAIAARGGEGALPGIDRADARARVVDGDWIFRQLALYELGRPGSIPPVGAGRSGVGCGPGPGVGRSADVGVAADLSQLADRRGGRTSRPGSDCTSTTSARRRSRCSASAWSDASCRSPRTARGCSSQHRSSSRSRWRRPWPERRRTGWIS